MTAEATPHDSDPVEAPNNREGAEVVEFEQAKLKPLPFWKEAHEATEIKYFFSDAEEVTSFLPVDTVGAIPPFPHSFWHPLRAIAWVVRMVFGIISLVVLLAVIAAIPLVNFLALGYLLEVEGRMARTGRLRFAFPLLDLAPRIGSIVLGTWAFLTPVRLLASAAADARMIDPGSRADIAYHIGLNVSWVLVSIHICMAIARGGSVGCFLRPLKNLLWLIKRFRAGDYWDTASSHIREFIAAMRMKHHFWLGVRGFFGAAIWLLIPTALFAALEDVEQPVQVIITLLGGVILTLFFSYIPFLQARYAAENRFKAMFELGYVRRLYKRAPISWAIAIILTFVLTLPLYLFKISLLPQDAMWGVTLVFIATIYPTKVLIGWSYHRAVRKTQRSWFGLRWICRAVFYPLLAIYVILLFFTQTISEHGRAVLYEHHAFMLPIPF